MESNDSKVYLLICLLIFSVCLVPTTSAENESNQIEYGMEYDWSNLDQDLVDMTGLDINGIIKDVMDSATEAGFNLAIGQATTGSTNFYVTYSEDKTTQPMKTNQGVAVDVWSRTTDVTFRHAVMFDAAILADWSESSFGSQETSFDVNLATDNSQVLIFDINYIEYFSEDSDLVGADMTFSMNLEFDTELNFEGMFKGDGEDLNVDISMDADFKISIDESQLEWRLDQPSSLYKHFAGNDYINWDCGDEKRVQTYEDYNEVYLEDECGSITGTYTSSASYDAAVSGIPTEEFLMDKGQLDLEISDNAVDTGSFQDTNIRYTGTTFQLNDATTIIHGGESIQVRECDCEPINPMILWTLEYILENGIEGVLNEIGDDFEEEIGEKLFDDDELSSDSSNDDTYNSANARYSIYSMNSDEIEEGYWSISANGYVSGFDIDATEALFTCKDGNEVSFDDVNDGFEDCSDGSDESSRSSSQSEFTCMDGDTIPFGWVNDGDMDCELGTDEGLHSHHTLQISYREGSNGALRGSQEITACAGSYSWDICDSSIYTYMDYDEQSIYADFNARATFEGDFSGNELCIEWDLFNSGNYLVESGQYCDIIGPKISYAHAFDDVGISLGFTAEVYNAYNLNGHSIRVDVRDTTGKKIYSVTEDIDGESYSHYISRDLVNVESEGNYCVEAMLLDRDGAEISKKSDCADVEDEPRPSEKLEKIAEAFDKSNFEQTIESFFDNLENKLKDIETNDFPFDDGHYSSFWSEKHGTIIGAGLYVSDDQENQYTFIGPKTAGYSDEPPVNVSIVYLSGQQVTDAIDASKNVEALEQIIDVKSHDTSNVAEVLVDAGLNPEEFGIGEDTSDAETVKSIAEEKADAGLLPFMSPVSLLTIILLSGMILQRKNKRNFSDGKKNETIPRLP